MTEDIGKLVKRQILELAQPGERGVQYNPPGRALAIIVGEIGNAYSALGPLIQYIQANGSNQDAQSAGQWIQQAESAIVGLDNATKSILQGDIINNARLLDAVVEFTGDQELYHNPEKLRSLARSWKQLDPSFKESVAEKIRQAPIQFLKDGEISLQAYATMEQNLQEAYTRFDELIQCGGRGVEGHSHSISIPDNWVSGKPIEETSEVAAFRNYVISSKMDGGIQIGGYSSKTCAWDGFKDKTSPGALAMISDKAIAIKDMLTQIPLTQNAPAGITDPLSKMASSYHKIAAAASPALYALKPVTTTAPVRGL